MRQHASQGLRRPPVVVITGGQAITRGVANVLYIDGHFSVAGIGLLLIGAEQPIPPWQIETDVVVGFLNSNGVMYPAPIRRGHQPALINRPPSP